MKELGIEEAGAQFSQLLAMVERGEEIRFTRNGEVVAELTPPGLCAIQPEWTGHLQRYVSASNKKASSRSVPRP